MSNPIQTKACRECGANEHFTKDVTARGGYGPDLLPIGFMWSSPRFTVRVCGKCGLVEWFVPQRHLAAVRERFEREG